MNQHYSFSFSFLLVTIFLCCYTIETALSYQLIPQRARSLFRQTKQQVSKRSFRNLDDEESESSDTYYDDSKPLQLGVVGLKLQQMAQKRTSMTQNSKPETVVANDIQSLRQAVLDEQKELKQVRIENYVQEQTDVLDHQVLQLIQERFESYSTPGNREDNSTLALAMEGGGMRGCVSAGMTAAIASLGLTGKKETRKIRWCLRVWMKRFSFDWIGFDSILLLINCCYHKCFSQMSLIPYMDPLLDRWLVPT